MEFCQLLPNVSSFPCGVCLACCIVLLLNVITLICSETDLKRYIENAVEVDPERPVLVDKYMDRADELDVDALCDKDGNVTICGIMQHIEQAGVHSGMHPHASALLCYHLCCKDEGYKRARQCSSCRKVYVGAACCVQY